MRVETQVPPRSGLILRSKRSSRIGLILQLRFQFRHAAIEMMAERLQNKICSPAPLGAENLVALMEDGFAGLGAKLAGAIGGIDWRFGYHLMNGFILLAMNSATFEVTPFPA